MYPYNNLPVNPAGPSPQIIQQTNDYYYASQIELTIKQAENECELAKKQAEKNLEIVASAEKQMQRSDIKEISKMRSAQVEITWEGEVFYFKNGFRQRAECKVSFKIINMFLLSSGKEDRKILALNYLRGNQSGEVYFWTDQLEEREISRKFNMNGLNCGLSREREKEFRQSLIQYCMSQAEERWLPKQHGWYFRNDKWHFAFPEDQTWEEVSNYAGK